VHLKTSRVLSYHTPRLGPVKAGGSRELPSVLLCGKARFKGYEIPLRQQTYHALGRSREPPAFTFRRLTRAGKNLARI
jgi:hypothetical protein